MRTASPRAIVPGGCGSSSTSTRLPSGMSLEELSGVSERPMIIPMTTTARPQQRYDHRLRDLVQGTGDLTIAMDLGVPRSTVRGWLGKAPTVVVSLDVTDLTASELHQEILELRRPVKGLTALRRLALALLRSSGFTLTRDRLPDGRAKFRILRAVASDQRASPQTGCVAADGSGQVDRLRSASGHAWTTRVQSWDAR
jgi:hypothetical protein